MNDEQRKETKQALELTQAEAERVSGGAVECFLELEGIEGESQPRR